MIFSIHKEQPFSFIYSLTGKFRTTEEFPFKVNIFWRREKKCSTMPNLTKKVLMAASDDKKKRTEELLNEYRNSADGEEFLRAYVNALEQMMFMTHHKLRQPVANILGMASVIEQYANSPETIQKIVEYMKQSALDLDTFSRDLSKFIADLEQKRHG